MSTWIRLFWIRLTALITGHKVIRLIGQPRVGGYMFVKSPELPGFSLMLRPGEVSDLDKLVAAIYEPLSAFLAAEYEAGQIASQRVRITGLRQADSTTYLADLCPA